MPPQLEVRLPGELLDLIFGHLDKDKNTIIACSLVSRQWNAFARPIVFSAITVPFSAIGEAPRSIFTSGFIAVLQSASWAPLVKEFTFTWATGSDRRWSFTPQKVGRIASLLPNLHTLNLTKMMLLPEDPDILREIGSISSISLDELHLSDVALMLTVADARAMRATFTLVDLLNMFNSINTLHLHNCELHVKPIRLIETVQYTSLDWGRKISCSLEGLVVAGYIHVSILEVLQHSPVIKTLQNASILCNAIKLVNSILQNASKLRSLCLHVSGGGDVNFQNQLAHGVLRSLHIVAVMSGSSHWTQMDDMKQLLFMLHTVLRSPTSVLDYTLELRYLSYSRPSLTNITASLDAEWDGVDMLLSSKPGLRMVTVVVKEFSVSMSPDSDIHVDLQSEITEVRKRLPLLHASQKLRIMI